MSQVIIHKNDAGGVAVIIPSTEALALYGIGAIAQKDVPAGRAYKIVDISELPVGVNIRYWKVNEADLTDGVGADWSTFPEAL